MLAIKEVLVMPQKKDWFGKRVVVIGAARQGVAIVRYLIRHGAVVVVNDRLTAEKLGPVLDAFLGEKIEWVLGGHPIEMLAGVDTVFISGGVPFDLPVVSEAKARGIEISNDSQLFLELCPCRVIGITGSAGKTTTTTLVGMMAKAAGDTNIWVGGNIGTPLLSVMEEIEPDDLAVMELSSFQLEVMSQSPHIAALLNITPNHLDRHKTMDDYTAAKARILQFQSEEDTAVLNEDDPIIRSMIGNTHGRLVTFSKNRTHGQWDNVFYDFDTNSVTVKFQSGDGETNLSLIDKDDIPLRGEHNLQNVLAACAISWAAGIPVRAMATGIRQFEGIPHRLEYVRTWGGGDWYNDSIATAPERAIAGINSFSEPMILLAGGQDKDLPWDRFVNLVANRVKCLILFGEASEIISAAMQPYEGISNTEVVYCKGLKEAVQSAAEKVSNGDVVLLSPGGTSFDEFHDFEDRGEAFRKWVLELR